MAGWREQKRKSLGHIHGTFEVPAVYLTHAAGTPVRANVRLHIRPVVADVQVEDWTNAGKMLDTADRIIFRESEVAKVLPKAYVVFGNSEAYLTGPSKPKRDGFIWVEVSEVSKVDLSALLAATDTDHPAWEGILS